MMPVRDFQKPIHSVNNNIDGATLKWTRSYHARGNALNVFGMLKWQNNLFLGLSNLVYQGTVCKK